MAASALTLTIVQCLLLMNKVASITVLAEARSPLMRHQDGHGDRAGNLDFSMDSHGRMQVKAQQHNMHRFTRTESKDAPDAESTTGKLKSMYPFYHTTDEIRAEAKRLSGSCGGFLNMTTLHDGDVDLDVITVRKASAKPVNRVFILFGEHSRELISPESGLHFLKGLCGEVKLTTLPELLQGGGSTDGYRNDVLEKNAFQFVLNANPRSRRKVESGDFCLRANPNGVDLNRNWDEEWQGTPASSAGDTSPGPKPFSEPETRILKRLVTEYSPTTFLTVHSGTRGMYMPWAYDMHHLAKYNEPSMMEILKKLDKDHCQCPFGAAGKEVGYPCPGTCLDYAYGKLNTPFVFAFEIYVNSAADDDLKERWEHSMNNGGAALIEQGHHLGHSHFRGVFGEYTSDFVQMSSKVKNDVEAEKEHDACMSMFNPSTEDDYNKTVQNWADVYLQMSLLVTKKLEEQSEVIGSMTPAASNVS